MKAPVQVKKIVRLTFPPDITNQPLVFNLVRRFDLKFSILQAQISPNKEGRLTLELSGEAGHYRQGIEYLRETGVDVRLVSRTISRDDDRCMHCGACTALCPTHALSVDAVTRKVEFDKELCTACGQCERVCPVHVMRVDTE